MQRRGEPGVSLSGFATALPFWRPITYIRGLLMAGVEIIRRAFDAFAQDGGETLIRSCRLEVEMHAVTNFVADREAYRGPEELCQRRVPGRSRVVRPDLRWNLEL